MSNYKTNISAVKVDVCGGHSVHNRWWHIASIWGVSKLALAPAFDVGRGASYNPFYGRVGPVALFPGGAIERSPAGYDGDPCALREEQR
jgi:hypothetical protein